MKVDPQLAALRGDLALQRRIQRQMDEAMGRLASSSEWSQIMADMAAYGKGAKLHNLPSLHRLLSKAECAQEWIAHWVRSLSASLAENPFGQIPFRHNYSPGLTTMQLAAEGRAMISLLIYEKPVQETQAQSALFVDGEQRDLVVSGHAIADCFTYEAGSSTPIKAERRELGSGTMIDNDGPNRARVISGVKDCLVMLQLARMSSNPEPSREIQLSDGALLRQSAGDKRASQSEMAIALLGAMKRRDAAPVITQMTAHGPDHLRWEALRQSLHLDTIQGFAALRRLASDEAEPLAHSARALKCNLERIHPELAQLAQLERTA